MVIPAPPPMRNFICDFASLTIWILFHFSRLHHSHPSIWDLKSTSTFDVMSSYDSNLQYPWTFCFLLSFWSLMFDVNILGTRCSLFSRISLFDFPGLCFKVDKDKILFTAKRCDGVWKKKKEKGILSILKIANSRVIIVEKSTDSTDRQPADEGGLTTAQRPPQRPLPHPRHCKPSRLKS